MEIPYVQVENVVQRHRDWHVEPSRRTLSISMSSSATPSECADIPITRWLSGEPRYCTSSCRDTRYSTSATRAVRADRAKCAIRSTLIGVAASRTESGVDGGQGAVRPRRAEDGGTRRAIVGGRARDTSELADAVIIKVWD